MVDYVKMLRCRLSPTATYLWKRYSITSRRNTDSPYTGIKEFSNVLSLRFRMGGNIIFQIFFAVFVREYTTWNGFQFNPMSI